MRGTEVVAACVFNKLQAAGLFLALDGTSTRTDPCTSGRKYHKSVDNAVFIRNESLFVVSAAATSAFQLEHTPRLRSLYPADYEMKYGLSNMGKYLSCRSMGNTMGAYTKYITRKCRTLWGEPELAANTEHRR